MKAKLNTALFAFFLLAATCLLKGCFLIFDPNCEGREFRRFYPSEEALFPPYQENDSIPFVNLTDGKPYYFLCKYREYKERDTLYNITYECDNGNDYYIRSEFLLGISSNYQNGDYDNLSIRFQYISGNEILSRVLININGSPTQYFNLSLNSKTGHFESVKKRVTADQVQYLDSMFVNGNMYSSVYKFFNHHKAGQDPSRPAADTIYFNSSHGILKIVSNALDMELVLDH